MTRKERVAHKKQGFKTLIMKVIHDATDLTRGMEKGATFIEDRIRSKPQEKTFYMMCWRELVAELRSSPKGGEINDREKPHRSTTQQGHVR